jgi:hypothetical protein
MHLVRTERYNLEEQHQHLRRRENFKSQGKIIFKAHTGWFAETTLHFFSQFTILQLLSLYIDAE